METLTLTCLHRVSEDRTTEFWIVRVDGAAMADPGWCRAKWKALEDLLMTKIVLVGSVPIDTTKPSDAEWKIFGQPSLVPQVKSINLNLAQWRKRTWTFGQEKQR
jgi:hypothetical protein